MMFYNLHVLDIAIILAYLIVCLVIGFKTSGKVKNIRDYAIGSGHISTAVLVGTFFATDIGAGQTVGVVQKIHTMGLIFIIALSCRPFAWLVASWIFSGNIGHFKDAGCISISDIMEKVYGIPGRWITNCVALCNAVGILALQVTAITYLFNYFLGISSTYCAIVAFAVLVTYSVMGGIRAVAVTDLMQACVFFVGIPLMCFLAVDNIGMSFDSIISNLPAKYTSVDFSSGNIISAVSIALMYISTQGTGVPFIQRYLMANTETQLRRSLRDCFYISVPFTSVIIIAGLISVVAMPGIDPNMAFYYLINTYLPIGIKGFVVTGLLAVIMSTADSWLNTASIICAHDIISKLLPKLSDRQILLASRIFTVIIAGAAAVWAILHGKSIMDFVWFINNTCALMVAPIVFGLFKVRSTPKALVVSCLTAMLGVLFGYHFTGELARVSTLTGIIGSTIGLCAMHYGQKDSPKFNFRLTMKLPTIYSPWRPILKFSEKQVRIHGHNYYLAGGLGIIFFISSIFLYNPHGSSVMLLSIRAISALLCLGLMFHERLELSSKEQQYLALYYHIVLMVVFPLISGYMMLLTGFSAFWVMSLALAILMMNLVCGITMTALLTPIGLLGAHLLWKKSGGYVIPIPVSAVHIGFTIILLVITARIRHNFQRSMMEIKEMYSTMLAHQVMQPIAQMSMAADHIRSIFESGKEDMEEIKSTVNSLGKMGYKAKELVNGLLMLSREDIAKAQDVRAYYIQDVIEEALLIYSEKELARITVDKSRNFRFNASKMFMVEVIRNLISNSFKYAGKDAKVEIFCGPRALYIRDNGRGIEKERVRYIFDHTRNSNGQTTGAGFGLAFVKRVVDSFSCAIICRSELGKYTEFVIGFPRL